MAILGPRKLKHKRQFKGRSRGLAKRGTRISFGSYGLKSLGTHWITVRKLAAARKAIMRYFKKGGKLWIRIFPDKPITSRGTEFTMGGGKGSFSHYVYPIKPGRIIFELEGVKEEVAKEAFRKASDKLPIKTKFITK